MTLYSKHYFVTGGNGWLGKRVVRRLLAQGGDHRSNDVKVTCLVPPEENIQSILEMGVRVVRGGVNDFKAVNDFMLEAKGGTVVHLAGVIHPPGRSNLFHAVNVIGAENILNAAKKFEVKRLVVMSSNSPFGGNKNNDELFDETSPYNPYMGYGESKMLMEKMMFREIDSNNTDLEIVILRAPWFYGPGQPARQTQFFSMIKEGKFPIIGNGQNKRSMGYVDNLADGIYLASHKKEAANNVFWLADKNPYPMIEILSTVKDVLKNDFGMKVSDKQIFVPSIISDIARVSDRVVQGCGLYNQKIHVLSEMNMTIACDIKKAQSVIGYNPMVSLRDGMKESIRWCLSNGQKI
jgi:nucleoside-diphosphate-sugar epimerase